MQAEQVCVSSWSLLQAPCGKMMLRNTHTAQVTSRPVRSVAVPSRVAVRRSARVQASDEQSLAPPAVDFSPNTQAATGYVEFDTAGQSNMYPVITKAYEVGSDADTTNTGAANLVIGAGAAVVGLGVLAVGLGALTQQGSAPSDGIEQFKSLSEYAAAFAAEL